MEQCAIKPRCLCAFDTCTNCIPKASRLLIGQNLQCWGHPLRKSVQSISTSISTSQLRAIYELNLYNILNVQLKVTFRAKLWMSYIEFLTPSSFPTLSCFKVYKNVTPHLLYRTLKLIKTALIKCDNFGHTSAQVVLGAFGIIKTTIKAANVRNNFVIVAEMIQRICGER